MPGPEIAQIVAPTGVHDLVLQDPTGSQPLSTNDIWLARQGNDLVVSVIGATAQVTIQGFFTQSTAFSDAPPDRRGRSGAVPRRGTEPGINQALPSVVQLMAQYAAQDQDRSGPV